MEDNSEEIKNALKTKAFTALSDWSRLLITIASGMLALSVTFFRVIKVGQNSLEYPCFLVISWLLLLASIVWGCFLVGSLVGHLNTNTIATLNAQDPKLMCKSFVQWITFLLGIGFFIVYGIINLL